MIKQTIQYTDYNGTDRDIDVYFHLNEAEIIDMQANSPRGIEKELEEAVKSNDVATVLNFITNLVHKSYGVKSDDGIHFEKSPELLQKFINSAYYSEFLFDLIENNAQKGEAFFNGIMPKKLLQRAAAEAAVQQGAPAPAPSARERLDEIRESKRTQVEQPRVVQVEDPAPTAAPAAQAPNEDAEYLAWKAEKARREQAAYSAAAPASPDAFRVPAEEQPMQGLPRPPHQNFA